MYHPWAAFAKHPEWTLVQADLPARVRGCANFLTRTVTLDRNLRQVERRCTIAHEVIHIERGPLPAHPWLASQEEAAVTREAARRLIALHALGEALAWARHPSEAADALWVTDDVLRVRMQHLHPVERAYLRERMAHRHECEDVL